ncbi:hypothetical protein SPB21_11835 [Leptothoe sp. ISB3NOV94-8A]|uniref:Uncharacterized protein n=1 Tax=Adonisia turfae CCMR0081 TaxID=2292702 RepID=A0A6M0RL14_9CYAN|nr:hypothetical protein [Adonisia turfae]NEZ56473.1 hypothetical protein [Adonisia turfae CCMR0081]
MEVLLSEREAYTAMYAFLVKLYDRTQSDDLGGLLGDMSTLEDGDPADPAVWSEWIECIEKTKNGQISTRMELSAPSD